MPYIWAETTRQGDDTCIYACPSGGWILIDKQGAHTSYESDPVSPPPLPPCNRVLYLTSGWKMRSEICHARARSDASARHSEDDSKCHSAVWGQPSQTHSSCRGCCHPPPHCLCKWCLQSPSNMWSFSPSLRHSPSPSLPPIAQIVPAVLLLPCFPPPSLFYAQEVLLESTSRMATTALTQSIRAEREISPAPPKAVIERHTFNAANLRGR